MRLIKTFGQLRPGTDQVEATFNIVVAYDPITNIVEEVLQVLVFDVAKNHYTDITPIMCNDLSKYFDKLIDDTDWREEYRNAA